MKRRALFSGPYVRTRRLPWCDLVRFDGASRAVFEGAFFTTMNGTASATFAKGEINTMPASIDGVPVEGTAKLAMPELLLPSLMLDAEGRGYFCAEVTCEPEERWRVKKVEMVQVADPNTDDGKPGGKPDTYGGAAPLTGYRARWPVAMLRDRGGGVVDLFQNVYHDLTHRIAFQPDGTPARHFFGS